MALLTRRIGSSLVRLGLLALLALALYPPGPSSPVAHAEPGDPPPAPAGTFPIFLPLVAKGGAAPDLIFWPNSVALAPGETASVSVRVEPQADLGGATFELPSVQDGVSSRFEAAADGATGTLTIEASMAAEADERALMVQGTF
jgi:hypothetical protein